MKIEGYNNTLSATTTQVYEYLSIPDNFKNLLPQPLLFFEATTSTFIFQLEKIPFKISLEKKQQIPDNQLSYQSIGNISFEIFAHITADELNNKTLVSLSFEGSFNPMMRMLVEKPIRDLLKTISQNLSIIEES